MTAAALHPDRRRRSRAIAVALTSVLAGGLVVAATPAYAASSPEIEPTFQDGLSQAVFTKVASEWINEEAWVESEVDSDRDGKPDLVHIDVTRVPETAAGLKVPVLMEMSPYYAGGTQVFSSDPEMRGLVRFVGVNAGHGSFSVGGTPISWSTPQLVTSVPPA